MITYIKKNINGNYVTLDNELDSASHNDIGTTYEHYLNNWWVRLNDEQVKFHQDNPNASIEEVINMELTPVPQVDELVEAKKRKLTQIVNYDRSYKVNNFIINDYINAWFTVQERLNYKQSVEAAKLLGEETLDFLVNGMPFTVSVTSAEYMLAQIQRYADKCYMVTEQHKYNVNNLTTVEEINNYDYTQGYPEMLKFVLV